MPFNIAAVSSVLRRAPANPLLHKAARLEPRHRSLRRMSYIDVITNQKRRLTMTTKRRTLLLAAVAIAAPLFASQAYAAGGLVTIIVNDPSNPYWLTEGNVAAAEAQKLGYTATVGASKGDTNTESNLIDTAITNKSVAIILDPADASGSIGAVKKAIAANIPVFLVNAEINQEGLAKAQLVSNNAQGAALGGQQWVKDVGEKGNYVELLGAPSDNNAATRSNGYETVLSQYPDLKKVGSQVANWDCKSRSNNPSLKR